MKLGVKVKFGDKPAFEVSGSQATVVLTEPPEKGKANKQLCELLAKKFGVPSSQIRIVSGAASRKKIVEI